MKKLKKWGKALLCIIAVLLVCRYSWIFLINHGYIPLTAEYERRTYMKLYKKNVEAFDVLIYEISELNDDIPTELYGNSNKVNFLYQKSEWNIYIWDDSYEDIFAQKTAVQNMVSIEQIENAFDTYLRGITYIRDEKQYIFHLGEYYCIYISDEGVTVK